MVKEWKPIAGLEGRYEVSSDGEVRSLPRYAPCKGGQRFIKPRILERCVFKGRGCNRARVTLSYGETGKQKSKAVCWIVAEAFLGAVKGDKVRNLNRDENDCSAKNLFVVKRSEASYAVD